MNNKIGIFTWHYYQNFGSALQCFALQSILESMGEDVKVINYRNPKFGSVNIFKENICYILAPILQCVSKRFKLSNLLFRKKYINETRLVRTSEEICEISKHFDVIVYGSDQIWAPNLLNTIYLGEHVDSTVRKISYAASIGLNNIPDNLLPTYKYLLGSFYKIGIREQEGKDLIKAKCDMDSTVVLDPTLMLDVQIYSNMQRKVNGIKQPYLFCYFLNTEHHYKDRVQKYAYKHNLQIIGVSDQTTDNEWMTRLTGLGADQFLWLINHAETIMTDSYHGSIFSLLFHKNLWIFQRFDEENPICQNSRIRQLNTYFNLSSRIIYGESTVEESLPIDYEYFESKLNRLRASSIDFLRNALK